MKNGISNIRNAVRPPLFEKARNMASIAMARLKLNKELRKLSELVIRAQEAERRRIARDLHDSVSQILSSVAFRLGMIDAQISCDNKEVKDEMDRAKTLLTRGIDEIQRISDDLLPCELNTLGLVPALRSLCSDFQNKTRLPLQFECDSAAERLSDAMELTLYRITQEGLNNIEKHSGASQATLRLHWSGSFVSLAIHDNGKGLLAAGERGRQPHKWGMGLLNMRERAAFLGGTFSIQSMRGHGTEIVVRIPLPALDGKLGMTQL